MLKDVFGNLDKKDMTDIREKANEIFLDADGALSEFFPRRMKPVHC